ncbi:alpha/beta fold hydrolase [Pseudomonas jilinensis]|uniref:AB hydrolase-1 domain-containing protein n=1 Tax=Pseudomonas jilinensis TaxID=2078689 RepID=A0A396S288_9PSED|nr:alpha/beta hydrolase [Pseudomonas jilinensis]RHW23182.1 hypothetical protein C2846_01920 [Pseudomonas jilinensis]
MLNIATQGDGPALVWAHGLFGSMTLESACGWFHPAADGQLRRIRYDARGHGQSCAADTPEVCQWTQLATEMLRVAEQTCSSEPFALGGQSMGCATALHAALQQPQRVSHLVMALPPTAWDSRPHQVLRYQKMIELLRRQGVAGLVKASRRFPPLPTWLRNSRSELAGLMLDELAGFTQNNLINILQGAAASDLPSPAALQQLSIPALILAWGDDDIHPLSTAQGLARWLPNNELIIANSNADLQQWPALIDAFITGR